MKNIKYIITIIGLFITVLACSEEYLNEPKPTDVVSPDIVYGSYEGAKAHIAGILRRTRGQFLNTENGNMGSMYFAREVKGTSVRLVVVGSGMTMKIILESQILADLNSAGIFRTI